MSVSHVDIAVANLPQAPEQKEAPSRASTGSPGISPPEPGFSPPTVTKEEHDEEMEFFLKDDTGEDAAAQAQEAAEGAAPEETPSQGGGTSEPVSVGTDVPAFDPNLLAIAEQFGLTKEEAESYGEPAHLLRTLNIMARNYDARAEQPVSQPAAKAAEPEFEPLDIAQMEADGFDPAIINLAKATNALKSNNDKLLAKLGEYEKVVPHLVQNEKQRQAAQREQGIVTSFRDAGYDATTFDASTRQKIVARVSALYQTYQREGAVPPVTEIIQAVIPMVVGRPKANGTPARNGSNNGQIAAADQRRLAAAARAAQMDRRRNGTFKGIPSHARGGDGRGGDKLRQTMIDKGYDPGQPALGKDEDVGGMLPG